MSSLSQLAEIKAAERLVALRGHGILRESNELYTKTPEQNLVPGVEKPDFWPDLDAGAGSELSDSPGKPAKFCAAFSSSALAVNTFGPYRNQPNHLELFGHSGFQEACFEKTLPTGLLGTPPHLDFFASGPKHCVCIESKFLEPLSPKVANFAVSYERAVESLAEASWATVYQGLKSNPLQYSFLDAAQLVKHYLGMRNTLAQVAAELVLIYLYWEPTNADDLEPFIRHRDEVASLVAAVKHSRIKFMAKSYTELWADWRSAFIWKDQVQHVSHLEDRYSFALQERHRPVVARKEAE